MYLYIKPKILLKNVFIIYYMSQELDLFNMCSNINIYI